MKNTLNMNTNFSMKMFIFDTIVEVIIHCNPNKSESILRNTFNICKYYNS